MLEGQTHPTLNIPTVLVLMKALGIDSVADLARRAGMDRTYLSRVMRGQRPAQPSHIVALARALKVPAITLAGPDDAEAVQAELDALPEAS